MLFPYGTDAPLYHYPITTVTCIVINMAMFVATGAGDYSDYRFLILEFDQINPIQWVTAAFMHASWMHLIGNMIFLWCFGLIVEGKLGAGKFAALYLCLALADGAIGQVPMYFISGEGGALGASGVIFALMAVAMIWAPENDIHCIFSWSFWYVRQWDIPVFCFAGFYLVMQLIPLAIFGVHMSTPLLHLMGMAVGFPAALLMLKRGWVDCEGWDLISRHRDRDGKWSWNSSAILGSKARREALLEAKVRRDMVSTQSGRDALELIRRNPDAFNPPTLQTGESLPDRDSLAGVVISDASVPSERITNENPDAMTRFRGAIELRDVFSAGQHYTRLDQAGVGSKIKAKWLVRYVELLAAEKMHVQCLSPLSILARQRGRVAQRAALRLAKIQLQVLKKPTDAAKTLAAMPAPWPPDIQRKRNQMLQIIFDTQSAGYTDRPSQWI